MIYKVQKKGVGWSGNYDIKSLSKLICFQTFDCVFIIIHFDYVFYGYNNKCIDKFKIIRLLKT